VVLHPASDFSAEIEGNLKHLSFKDTIPYEALSYVWGDPQPRASISLDDCPSPAILTRHCGISAAQQGLAHYALMLYALTSAIFPSAINK
jgi:hypothetical protein